MATLTTTTAAAAATPRSALRIFRDYVDAFNRRDRDGIRRTFHEECRTCHPDKTELDVYAAAGPAGPDGPDDPPECPGERVAARLFRLASSGATINVIRAFSTPPVDEAPTSGTSAMFAEIQLVRNGIPFLSECVMYSAAEGRCISYTVYLLAPSRERGAVYSKVLPAFRGWGSQEPGLDPPTPCASAASSITVVCCNGWGSLSTEGWMATVVPLLEARGAKIIRYDKRPKDDALGNHVSRLADLLASHGWAHASIAGAENKFSGGAASRKWEDLYFLGQSAGNQIIVRYLASLPEGVRIGGYFGVAAWWKLLNPRAQAPRAPAWDGFMDKFGAQLQAWEDQDGVDFVRARAACGSCKVLISCDDPIVNLDDGGDANRALWEERLGADVSVVAGREHFIFIDRLMQQDLCLLLRFFGLSLV
jgi:hypothetical protein